MKRLLLLMACAAAAACSADWRDTSLPPQKRAELLTAEMTLDEKIGQLTSPYGWEMYERHGDSVRLTDAFREAVQNGHIGMLWGTFRADPWTQKDLRTGLTPQLAARLANRMQRYAVQHSRLGIPLFLAEEAPHGHMAIGATTFPTAPGQASTWNPELIERMGKVIAAEIRLQGGHICYGPVLDIVRDPRWSRTEESYGEDCYLTARIGEAYVRGTGSGDLSQSRHALSTLKHFIAYGASEGGQNGGSNLLGERELRETYLPPFEAAVKAGARSVMTAYNSVDGIPCTANRRMLTDILRGEWGFDGFVVSDLLSIEGLHETHGVAGSVREAAVQALRAGVDADLKGGAFASLREAAEAGDVAEAEIDRAVERVLALKFEMGLFENPYIDEAAAAEVGCAAHSELALEAARQSVTLLENRSGTLPLDPRRLRRVAVIGPNADNIYNQFRYYSPKMGMYISSDPIGLAGGNPTLYGYVFDPNTQVDPFGLDCDKVNKARARQHKMLQDNKGFNISPTDWDAYPSIGRNGTFITDCKGALGYFGNFKKGDTITISSVKAAKIESDMGLNPGSLQNGFKIREVSGISSMNPRSPLEGNEYFLGGGQHLPGGAPEMVINSIPTTDNASVTTILTVLVK